MKMKCYSVRLESLVSISDLAFRAKAFDGSEAVIPKSQVMGADAGVVKSDAYWITAWILERKSIQFSRKKEAWFDENGKMLPTYQIEHHKPERINVINNEPLKELTK